MSDINNIIVIGRATRDSELKESKDGLKISKFSIANNYSKDKLPNYFDVIVFGEYAGTINNFVKKGNLLGLQGSLRQCHYEDQEGQKKNKIEIIANSVQLLKESNNNDKNNSESQDELEDTNIFND